MIVSRTGSTISIENGRRVMPLEATAPDKFIVTSGVTVEFDAAKKQMTVKRPQGERIFTKEN